MGQNSEEYEKDKFDIWIEEKLGKEKAWKFLMIISVLIAIVAAVAIFMLLPTVAVGWLSKLTDSIILLNLAEGALRMIIFVAYIMLISKMNDIKTVFQYHGAEHKTIHCFENNQELTPENAPSKMRNQFSDVRHGNRRSDSRSHGLAQRLAAHNQ